MVLMSACNRGCQSDQDRLENHDSRLQADGACQADDGIPERVWP